MFGIMKWGVVPTQGFWEARIGGGGQHLYSCSPWTFPQNQSISKHHSPIPLHALCGCSSFILIGPTWQRVRWNLRWQEGCSPKFQTKTNNVKGSESGSLIGTLWPAADRGGKKPRCLQQPWQTHRHLGMKWNLTESGKIRNAEDSAWDGVVRAACSLVTGWQLKTNSCPALEWAQGHQDLGGVRAWVRFRI